MEFLECYIDRDMPGTERWASRLVAASAIVEMKRPYDGGNWHISYAHPGAASPSYANAADAEVRRFLRANSLKGVPVIPALPGTTIKSGSNNVRISHWLVQPGDPEDAFCITALDDDNPVPCVVEAGDVLNVEISAGEARPEQGREAPQLSASDVSADVDASVAVRAASTRRAANDW